MAMIGDAPANRALAIAESPTPRTRSPRPNPHARHCRCSPRRRGRPSHRSQASRPPRGRRSDRPGCIGARVPGSYRRTRAERRGQLRAVGQRHRPAGVEGVEAIPGAARGGKPGSDRRPRASSARRSHRSPHVTAVPADSTMPAASWPSRNGKSSLIAVAVGQIGMTHPACLDPHHHVVRARIRDVDLGEFDGRTFAAGDDALDLLCHVKTWQFGCGPQECQTEQSATTDIS